MNTILGIGGIVASYKNSLQIESTGPLINTQGLLSLHNVHFIYFVEANHLPLVSCLLPPSCDSMDKKYKFRWAYFLSYIWSRTELISIVS